MVDQVRRTGNVSDQAYLADYPNAIVNPAMARDVAYATKTYEEEIATLTKAIREVMLGNGVDYSKPFDIDFGPYNAGDRVVREKNSGNGLGADRSLVSVRSAFRTIEAARFLADDHARFLIDNYEVLGWIDDISKGKSVTVD